MHVCVYLLTYMQYMCVHAQILIQKSWYFEDKYEDRLFTTKNVQSAKQIDNPFISVSTTHITYPFNLNRNACVCNHTPSE